MIFRVEGALREYCISAHYTHLRGDGGVFRPREDMPRSAYSAVSPRSRRRPLKYFSLLAACELAGALGLVLGIWLPWARQAAGVGLVIYFVGAVVSHLRVRDIKDIGPALFMLMVAAGALVLRVLRVCRRPQSCHLRRPLRMTRDQKFRTFRALRSNLAAGSWPVLGSHPQSFG